MRCISDWRMLSAPRSCSAGFGAAGVEGHTVNENALRLERRLQIPLLIAAALTIPAIVLAVEYPDGRWHPAAVVLDGVIWAAFVLELVLMLRAVDHPSVWLREHPLEVAIVVLTPPFLPPALEALRILRLLRLIRVGPLLRQLTSPAGVRDISVLAVATILIGGSLYAAVEKSQDLSSWDGAWWALVTVTTVGYGDTYPQTDLGRIIALVVMLVGIAFVAILTAAAAQRFISQEAEELAELAGVEQRLDEVLQRLDRIERSQ